MLCYFFIINVSFYLSIYILENCKTLNVQENVLWFLKTMPEDVDINK